MNYIIDFSNDPNSLTPTQMSQLKSALVDAVKSKISNVESKYNVKLKFPPNICNATKNNNKLPLPIIPATITPTNLSVYVPFSSIMTSINPENTIDGISSCMRIVNSIKNDLELFATGKKTKEQVDSTFIEWNEDNAEEVDSEPKSEIDEMYEKKFGRKALIKKLIQDLEYPSDVSPMFLSF
jgi:hypothetical protein